MLCYKVFCLGGSSGSVKSFVSLNPMVLKFETEVFSGAVLQNSTQIGFQVSSAVSKNNEDSGRI